MKTAPSHITIPYERIGETSGTSSWVTDAPVITHDNVNITHDCVEITHDDTQTPPENASVSDRILAFCEAPKHIAEITEFLGYKERKTTRKYLAPLLKVGRLSMTIPDKPQSRNQKYITIQ